jgi:hypothetical protein
MREVCPKHNNGMGYKYRARIEHRQRKTWFGFGKVVDEYRYVIERHFVAWKDDFYSRWFDDQAWVKARADRALSRIEAAPKGEYL